LFAELESPFCGRFPGKIEVHFENPTYCLIRVAIEMGAADKAVNLAR
jgi:hypothetical protein